MARLVWEDDPLHPAVALNHSVLEFEAHDLFSLNSGLPTLFHQDDRHHELHNSVSHAPSLSFNALGLTLLLGH